jgi:hypothetical protein
MTKETKSVDTPSKSTGKHRKRPPTGAAPAEASHSLGGPTNEMYYYYKKAPEEYDAVSATLG